MSAQRQISPFELLLSLAPPVSKHQPLCGDRKATGAVSVGLCGSGMAVSADGGAESTLRKLWWPCFIG